MEKWEKNHLSGQFSKGGTGTKQSGIGTRGGKIGPAQWASPVHPELGRAGPLNY